MSVPTTGTKVESGGTEVTGTPMNERSEGTNEHDPRPSRDKVVTFWCGPTYPCDTHKHCSGTWVTQAGGVGPCQCSCHPSYDEEEALQLMDLEACPRCGWGWDGHDYDAGRIVCQEKRRRVARSAE